MAYIHACYTCIDYNTISVDCLDASVLYSCSESIVLAQFQHLIISHITYLVRMKM